MSSFQCSFCKANYNIDEYLKLESRWYDEKKKETYGKYNICKCGMRMDQAWAIQSRKDKFTISTVHLTIGHTSTVNWKDLSEDFFYETMIFEKQKDDDMLGKPLSFQMRYKTQEEAIQGHKDTYEKLEMILLDPSKYPEDILAMFCNAIEAGLDQKKNIHPSVKERLT